MNLYKITETILGLIFNIATVLKNSPKFNIVKFDYEDEKIEILANSCGYCDTGMFGKIETTQPFERLMFLRNGFFFSQGRPSYLNWNAFVDIEDSSVKII